MAKGAIRLFGEFHSWPLKEMNVRYNKIDLYYMPAPNPIVLFRAAAIFSFSALYCSYGLQAQIDTLIFFPVNNPSLQQSYIRHISIAKDGKLWLCTNQGLASYDGNTLNNFNENSAYKSIDKQEEGLYVIEMNGIYHFDTKTGVGQYLDISLDSGSSFFDPRTYTDVCSDNNQIVWCARTNGLVRYEIQSKKTTYFPIYVNSDKNRLAVRCVEQNNKNNDLLWLGTDAGIVSFNKKTFSIKRNFLPKNVPDSTNVGATISNIYSDETDTLWFTAGKSGVGSYDTKTGKYVLYPCKKVINHNSSEIDLTFLQSKNKEELYIGASDICPAVFNKRTHRFTFHSRPYKDLPALSIGHFVADKTGNLWCSIFGQLYYASAHTNKFSTTLLKNGHQRNRQKNIFKTAIWDDRRKLYYAAFDNSDVIFVLDSNMQLVKSIPVATDDNKTRQSEESHIYDISLDANGQLWACGTTVSIFDSVTQSMVPAHKIFKNLVFGNQRFQNIISRNNYLYLQPSNIRYNAMYQINVVSHTVDSFAVPYQLAPQGFDNSWNSGNRRDVAVIDKEGKYAYIGADNYILQINLFTHDGKKITRVTLRDNGYFFNLFWYAVDDDGNLWLTSSDGVTVINPENLKTIKKFTQGPETNRYQICNADGKGIMCLLYSGGIMLFDYKNNKEYHLSLSDGLITLFNSAISCVNNTLFAGAEFDALQHVRLASVVKKSEKRNSYLTDILVFNKPVQLDTLPQYLHHLVLPHDQNFVTLTFSSTEFEQPEGIEYRYKMSGVNTDWIYTNYLNRTISYNALKPGSYFFYNSVKNTDGSWNDNTINFEITIIPAWWQTAWFRLAGILALCGIIAFTIHKRIVAIRTKEQQKAQIEKNILELEAKALRAQMNPHFIFNCMNSIKSLMQENEIEKAIHYLTTFSKLIRTLFNNADKKEITLNDEIETCRLYLQLEAMRFDSSFLYAVTINEGLDLKSIKIPALIIQPFIENAIWHGIVPNGNGGQITLSVTQKESLVEISIDDNGIGREASKQNKAASNLAHYSKGVNLTQSRLELDSLLRRRQVTLEIIDKKTETNNAAGTKVIITLKESF